jgi:hypothetical protein
LFLQIDNLHLPFSSSPHPLTLQSAVIGNLESTENLGVAQLAKVVNSLPGLNVGVVNASIEEWRMRVRGANVTV